MILGFCPQLYSLSIRENIKKSDYSGAYDEILSLVRKNISIENKYPYILQFFKRNRYPAFYQYSVQRTNALLEEKSYKEALRMYRLLTRYEKNDEKLYKNYSKAYSYYVSRIRALKKALGDIKKGDVTIGKQKLENIEKTVDKKGELGKLVEEGKKALSIKVENTFIRPNIDKINRHIEQKQFEDAKNVLAMMVASLGSRFSKERSNELNIKIKRAEKQFILAQAEKEFQDKQYDNAIAVVQKGLESYPSDKNLTDKLDYYREQKLKAILSVQAFNYLKQGNNFYSARNYPRALYFYEQYLRIFRGEIKEDDPQISKRVNEIKRILEERRRKKYFDEHYSLAKRLIKGGDFKKALNILTDLKNYPYEKDQVLQDIVKVEKELLRIEEELKKEFQASNLVREANQKYNEKEYKEALDKYLQAYSLIEEVRGRSNLKLEIKHYIQKTEAVIKEIQRLKALEKRKRILEGIKRARREYTLGNYEKSIFYSRDVLALSEGNNLIAQEILELAQEALKIESVGKINPKDPFYSIFLSLKSEGEKLQKEAEVLYKKGEKEEGKNLFEEALNKWKTIKRAFPFNEVARKNIRYIFKYTDPVGWRQSIREDLNRSLTLARQGNKAAAYKIVQEVVREYPNFPRIQYYIRLTKPKDKKTNLTASEKMQARRLYNQALSAFSRRNYKSSLALTERIIAFGRYVKDPIMSQAKSLYIRIKTRVDNNSGYSRTNLSFSQNLTRIRYYRQALNFYQKGDYKKAINFCRRALRIDPNYNSARTLLDSASKRLR